MPSGLVLSLRSSRKLPAGLLGIVGLAALSLAVRRPALRPVQAQSQADPASAAFYTHNVQPILQANCYRCHAGMNHRGGLVLDSAAGLRKGGREGAVLVPGHPEQSLLVKLIRHEGPANDPMPMPPKSKLSDADIATVERWVKAGAILPAGQ